MSEIFLNHNFPHSNLIILEDTNIKSFECWRCEGEKNYCSHTCDWMLVRGKEDICCHTQLHVGVCERENLVPHMWLNMREKRLHPHVLVLERKEIYQMQLHVGVRERTDLVPHAIEWWLVREKRSDPFCYHLQWWCKPASCGFKLFGFGLKQNHCLFFLLRNWSWLDLMLADQYLPKM